LKRNSSSHPIIVLTGALNGGKAALSEEPACDPTWADRFAALLEAIFLIHV